jgi:hypothetical protein
MHHPCVGRTDCASDTPNDSAIHCFMIELFCTRIAYTKIYVLLCGRFAVLSFDADKKDWP